MKSLYTKALLGLVALSVTMGLLLFVPAGTRKYWQAWVYLGTIAFPASDAASYVVGQTIEVNGGQSML
jgi:NAD(P)-dependent dehydrogenase (short-subunit alcohol dehydrogenase family)